MASQPSFGNAFGDGGGMMLDGGGEGGRRCVREERERIRAVQYPVSTVTCVLCVYHRRLKYRDPESATQPKTQWAERQQFDMRRPRCSGRAPGRIGIPF